MENTGPVKARAAGNFFAYMFFTFFLFYLTVKLSDKVKALIETIDKADSHLSISEWVIASVIAFLITAFWCIFFLCWKITEKNCLAFLEQSPKTPPAVKPAPAKRKRRVR